MNFCGKFGKYVIRPHSVTQVRELNRSNKKVGKLQRALQGAVEQDAVLREQLERALEEHENLELQLALAESRTGVDLLGTGGPRFQTVGFKSVSHVGCSTVHVSCRGICPVSCLHSVLSDAHSFLRSTVDNSIYNSCLILQGTVVSFHGC